MGGSSVTYLLRPQAWMPLHVSKQSDIHQHCCQMRKLTALSGSINNLGTEAKRKYKYQTLSDLYSKSLHYCLMTPIIICYLKWWLLCSFYRWESWGMTNYMVTKCESQDANSGTPLKLSGCNPLDLASRGREYCLTHNTDYMSYA